MRRFSLYAAAASALLPVAFPAAAASHTYTVVVDQLKFGALPAQLHKGDVVVWDNRDMFRHSVTAVNGRFDIDLPPGASVRARAVTVGTTPFACKYHPGMKGVLKVLP